MFVLSGMQWIHKSRCESATWAEPYATYSAKGNWPDGVDYPPQVYSDWAAAEAEYVWGCHDIALTFPRCQVCNFFSFSMHLSCTVFVCFAENTVQECRYACSQKIEQHFLLCAITSVQICLCADTFWIRIANLQCFDVVGRSTKNIWPVHNTAAAFFTDLPWRPLRTSQ